MFSRSMYLAVEGALIVGQRRAGILKGDLVLVMPKASDEHQNDNTDNVIATDCLAHCSDKIFAADNCAKSKLSLSNLSHAQHFTSALLVFNTAMQEVPSTSNCHCRQQGHQSMRTTSDESLFSIRLLAVNPV